MYNKVAKVNKNQRHFHLYFCEFSSVISNCFRLQTSFYYCRIFTSLLIIKSLQALLILYYLWILFLLNYPQFFILFLRHQQHLSKHCLTSYFTYNCSTILHISPFISLSNIIPPFMLLISSLLTLSHCYLQTLVAFEQIWSSYFSFHSNHQITSTLLTLRSSFFFILKLFFYSQTLVAFEYLWYQAWVQSIDQAKAGLQATLIIRHPDDGKLYVNFDQEILQLIRESKCLGEL